MDSKGGVKPVRWVGSSLRDLRACPRAVRADLGQAIYAAQKGEVDPAATPLKGFGSAGVLEIISDYRGDTWRGVYTVRFEDAVYVLHVFKKKSTRGISRPKREIEMIRRRLAEAALASRERQN